MLLLAVLAVSVAQLPNMGLPAGNGVQRTMRLLAEGKPVRVMFYGQSITTSDWTKMVEEDLRKRFPNAKMEFRNMAIAGFSANLLKRTAERDSLDFYPDLVILHDYGGEPDYEELVRVLRSTTTAEVLLQSDHVTAIPTGKPEDARTDRAIAWHDQHATWMRAIAEKYGCAYVDVRAEWYARMSREAKPFTDFVQSDRVHLNAAGDRFMADLVGGYLVREPKYRRKDPVTVSRRTFRNGKVELVVEGSRIDLSVSSGAVDVLIDGKKPSSWKELYLPSRASNALGVWFPAMLKVEAAAKPLLETYRVRLSNVREDASRFDFTASGSLTGEDGSGDSYAPFVSKSGRVKILPADWATNYGYGVSKQMPKDGFEVTWTYRANFKDRADGSEWTTVAQGLPNGPHKLTLTSKSSPDVQIRVFNPPRFGKS